jgi:hypothetical protein
MVGGQLSAFFSIKGFNETLNPARLAFTVCNISIMRRLFFRFVECNRHFYHLADECYGFPAPLKGDGYDVNIPLMCKREHLLCNTPERALDYIMRGLPEFAKAELTRPN